MKIYQLTFMENDERQFEKYFTSMKKAVKWARQFDHTLFSGNNMDRIVTESNCHNLAEKLSDGQKHLFCASLTMGTYYSIVQYDVE